MANKTYDVRILLRNATDAQWASVEASFIPLKGEVILFEDGKYKIGNAETPLKDLPFYYGDKDTDTKYQFSVDPEKPATLIVKAVDKDNQPLVDAEGNELPAQEVTIPGIATEADLEDIEDRVDALEDKVDALTNPVRFVGAYESLDDANEALAPEDGEDSRQNGDLIIIGSKEYIWYKPEEEEEGDWAELGDTSGYQRAEQGKGLSSNDFTDELKEKLEAIDPTKYVEKEEGKGLLDDELKEAIEAALEKLEGIEEGATNSPVVSIDESSLLGEDEGATIAKITIGEKEYIVRAPQAGESKSYYLSNLEGTAPEGFDGEVIFSCGGAPEVEEEVEP